jgi:hypothetical protein
MSECSGSYYVNGIKVRSEQGVAVIDGVRRTVVAGRQAGEGEVNYKDLPSGTMIHVEAPDGVRIPLEFDPLKSSGRKGRGNLDLSRVPDEHKARALDTALDKLPLDSKESRKYAEKVHEEARDFVRSGFVGHHNMSDVLGTLLKRRGDIKSSMESSDDKHLRQELERVNETIKSMTGLDMSESDLSNTDLSDMDMSGSNMPGSNMSGSNMSGSNMSGSDMSGSNMSGSDMSGSDMSGSDMSGSDMSGSNMSGSDMSGSNMSGADLSGADLSGADLSGADLSGAGGKGVKWDENTIWPEGFNPDTDLKDRPDKPESKDVPEEGGKPGSSVKPGDLGEKTGDTGTGERKPTSGEQDSGLKETSERKPTSGKQDSDPKGKQGSDPKEDGGKKSGSKETGDKAKSSQEQDATTEPSTKRDGQASGKQSSSNKPTEPRGDKEIGYSRDRRGQTKTKAEQEAAEALLGGMLEGVVSGKGGGRVRGKESAPEKAMRLAAKRAAERISSMRYRDSDDEGGAKQSLSVIISPDVSGSTSAWSGTSEAFSSALSSVSGTKVSVTPNINGAWGASSMYEESSDTQGAMSRRLLSERSVLIYMGDNHGTEACQDLADTGASVIALDAGWQVGMEAGGPSGKVIAERVIETESSEDGSFLRITVRTHEGEHGGKLHWVSGVPMDSPLEWAASIDAVMKNLEELEAGSGGGEKNIGAILDRGQSTPPDEEVLEASRDIGEYLVSIGEESASEALSFVLSPDLSPSTSEWNPIAEAVSNCLEEIPGVSSRVVINSNGAWYADENPSGDLNERMSKDLAGGSVLVYLGDDQGYEHCQKVAAGGGIVIGVSSDPSPKGDFSDKPIVDVEQHGEGRVFWVSNVPTDSPNMVSEGVQEALRMLQSEKPASHISAPIVEGRVRMTTGRKPVSDNTAMSAARSVHKAIANLPQLEESRRQMTSGREWDTERLATLSAAERDVRPARVPKIKHQRKMVVSFDTSPSTVAWSGTGEVFAREVTKSRVMEGTVVQNSNGSLLDSSSTSAIEEADIVVYLGDEDGLAEFEKHVDREKAIIALCVSDSKEVRREPVERRSGGGWIYRSTGLPSDQPAAWAQALVRATKKLVNKW